MIIKIQWFHDTLTHTTIVVFFLRIKQLLLYTIALHINHRINS